MYSIGDQVVYGIHGICRICDIEQRRVDRKDVSYYVLVPLANEKTQYLVPVHNEAALAKMRPLVNPQQLEEILKDPVTFADCWIPAENLRKQRYKEITACVDFTATLQMVCTLRRHRALQLEAGKKFHMCDENFLRDAGRLVESEMAMVLRIAPHEVESYIEQYMR